MRLAEWEGFEPSIQVSPYNDLANRRLQPLGHHSNARSLGNRCPAGARLCCAVQRLIRAFRQGPQVRSGLAHIAFDGKGREGPPWPEGGAPGRRQLRHDRPGAAYVKAKEDT